MKQGIMRKTAILLIITLMAGVLCALASIRAKAEDSTDLYSEDLREYFLDLHPNMETNINRFFDLLNTALDPDNNYLCCALNIGQDWLISIYTSGNLSMTTWYSYNAGSNWNGISRNPYQSNINVNKVAYLYSDDGSLLLDFSSSNQGLTGPIAFDFDNPYYSLNYNAFPNTYNLAAYNVYTSRDIGSGSAGFTLTRNFFSGERPPVIQYFDMIKFNVGDKWFITPNDQILLRNMHDEGGAAYYIWYLVYDTSDGDDYSYAEWDDLTVIPSVFAPVGVQNINSDTFLALEVTPYMDSSYTLGVKFSQFWNVIQDTDGHETILGEVAEWFGYVSFTLAPDEKDITYNTAIEQFYNYYNTYNTTHFVPENLGEILYGLDGSMTMPVDVAAPRSLINAGEEYATDNFKYHLLFNDNPAFNMDLLDVVIFENNEPVSFNLRYWYDDTLSPKYRHVDWYTFGSLLDEFDLIIIISDDKGMLTDDTTSIAYCGSFSGGIEYTDNPIDTTLGNTMSGFAFVTKRGIQKQLLFNFNDGITKTYQLMVNYIDERQQWDDSFLLWSASIFNMLDTCNGKLVDIKNAIIDLNTVVNAIKETVNKIALDPDPDNTSPWYLSLWNFITQFEPSNDQISDAIDLLDENLNDIPLLPALTPVPALPTLGG